MAAEKKRQSNIELLRILAMLMILSAHYLDKGGLLPDAKQAFSTNGYLAWLIEAFCFGSVNAFFLISGYFGLSTKFTVKKLVNLWLQILTYSLGMGIVAIIVCGKKVDLYNILDYAFPLSTNHYWFATVYILLCFLTPFLAAGVNVLDKKTLQQVLGGFIIILCIVKTIIPLYFVTDQRGYDIAWMVCVYLTGMYIRKYGVPNLLKRKWISILGFFISTLAIYVSLLGLKVVYDRTGKFGDSISYGYSFNFLFCYLASVFLFVTFMQMPNIEGRVGKWINKIAGATFGIYLFHEQIDMRYLWPKFFHSISYADRSALIFLGHMIFSVTSMFAIGCMIEWVRQKVFAAKKDSRFFLLLFVFLFSVRNCFYGLDLMDAGYGLGNFQFLQEMNITWKLATYGSNLVGRLFSILPLGNYWLGMNFYTAILMGTVSVVICNWLIKQYPDKWIIILLGEIVALSACIAPTTILYHYLGYYMMSIAVLLLIEAGRQRKTSYYIIAGVILGLSLYARMPNITYIALIIPVWYAVYDARKIWKDNWRALLRVTGQCVTGYLLVVIPIYFLIAFRYGWTAYPNMIHSLFGMTDQATDYKPSSMISTIFGEYVRYAPWFFLFVVYLIIGVIIFNKALKQDKHVLTKIAKAGYIAGLLIILRFCYGRGFFGIKYNDFFAIYKWLVVYLLATVLLCIYQLIIKTENKDVKILSVFLLVMIFVTPLGSNNGLVPIMNNLFLVMPLSMIMFEKHIQGRTNYAVKSVSVWFLCCMSIQTILFGSCFIFHDFQDMGSLSKYTHRVEADITGSEVTKGLWTTSEKNQQLDELGTYLTQNQLTQEKVLLYGNIPAIAYIFEMEPAIFTTWPDLDSNTISRLEHDLQNISKTPVIITSKEVGKELLLEQSISTDKIHLLYDYMQGHQYHCSFFNDGFYVFTTK